MRISEGFPGQRKPVISDCEQIAQMGAELDQMGKQRENCALSWGGEQSSGGFRRKYAFPIGRKKSVKTREKK